MRRKEKQAQTVPLLGPTGQPTHPRQELITPESLDSGSIQDRLTTRACSGRGRTSSSTRLTSTPIRRSRRLWFWRRCC